MNPAHGTCKARNWPRPGRPRSQGGLRWSRCLAPWKEATVAEAAGWAGRRSGGRTGTLEALPGREQEAPALLRALVEARGRR